MKGSNIKSKMGRFTFSACALFLASGMFVACEDELLTGTPSWLGSSIYDELAKRGNFQTTLRLINDPEVSTLNSDGQTEYRRMLGLTGSKTLFVANDEAYARFFENNSWGARSYDDLTQSQKRTLFKSSMVNSAYLIELMSSESNNSEDPNEGSVIRRSTELSLFDSIPQLHAEDMPDNKYWKYYRSKYADGSKAGMLVMCDNTVSPMVHFLSEYMANKQITDDDLSFLTNGACNSTAESYINGQRLTERDITCQNGYVQVVENVMDPLTNMAEVIRNDEDLSIFNSFLDRFCVPVFDEGTTNSYNQYSSGEVDSIFVWRYFNDGLGYADGNNGVNNSFVSYRNENPEDLLPYDPGWNQYVNAAGGMPSYQGDMAVIIAPTNDAFNKYFQSGGGATLLDRYKEIDSIPDNIIIDMMDNFMKYSLVATVPSKFSTVTNTAQMDMGLKKEKFDECIMANNGVVYKANEVFPVPEYQSVSFPASLDDSIRIMRMMIDDGQYGLNYKAYLNSMESEYILILPSDAALRNYVDPVDFGKNRKTVARFYYDDRTTYNGCRVRANLYVGRQDADGSWVADLSQPISWDSYEYGETEYVQNRLKDVLENSIYVRNRALSSVSGQNVWVSKGGCPIILEGSGEGVKIRTAYRKELAGEGNSIPDSYVFGVRVEDGYYDMGPNPGGNGETYIVDKEPVMPATKSVTTVLAGLGAEYQEFRNLLTHSTLVSDLYDYGAPDEDTGIRDAKTVSNDTTINIMENFNYTIYVPPTAEINKLYAAGLLPDWRDIVSLNAQLASASGADREKLQAQITAKTDSIDNFIRYHVQNNAIYLNRPSQTGGTFETSYMPTNRFSTLAVDYTGNGISVTCRDGVGTAIKDAAGENLVRHVTEGNHFAREYHFRAPNNAVVATLDDARVLYNSSTAVIHLLDKPLLYSQDLSDKYSERIGN